MLLTMPEAKIANSDGVYMLDKSVCDTTAYQVYQGQFKNEMAKIQYLVNIVRFSDLGFWRNGAVYTGDQAAQWLEYKIDKFPDDFNDVESFIENIASHSRKSGKQYYIVLEDGSRCLFKALLYNEVRRLRGYTQNVTIHHSNLHLQQQVKCDDTAGGKMVSQPKGYAINEPMHIT